MTRDVTVKALLWRVKSDGLFQPTAHGCSFTLSCEHKPPDSYILRFERRKGLTAMTRLLHQKMILDTRCSNIFLCGLMVSAVMAVRLDIYSTGTLALL